MMRVSRQKGRTGPQVTEGSLFSFRPDCCSSSPPKRNSEVATHRKLLEQWISIAAVTKCEGWGGERDVEDCTCSLLSKTCHNQLLGAYCVQFTLLDTEHTKVDEMGTQSSKNIDSISFRHLVLISLIYIKMYYEDIISRYQYILRLCADTEWVVLGVMRSALLFISSGYVILELIGES